MTCVSGNPTDPNLSNENAEPKNFIAQFQVGLFFRIIDIKKNPRQV